MSKMYSTLNKGMNTGWWESRYTVVCVENNIIINNNTKISCVLCTHNHEPTFSLPCT